jgi:RNA-directed DNA polymerase
MGKRSAVVELLLGNMGSMQREIRPSMQREDQPTMATKLEQIAVKARRDPNLRFTSLTHHITSERVLKNLLQIPKRSAAGVDGQTVEGAKEGFGEWIGPMWAATIKVRTNDNQDENLPVGQDEGRA